MKTKKISRLEVILKTVEKCNINCTYCYFFNGQDDSYKEHPKSISNHTINQVCYFLKKAIEDLFIDEVMLIFHGGEPLLQKKTEFNLMCQMFKNELSSKTKLTFAMQTNATLVSDKWIDLLEMHEVGVGISLDGPKSYNDKYRIDHRGKGTYDRVIKGLNLLTDAAKNGRIKPPGLLSVINPIIPPELIYKHFVHDLKFKFLDFLLPDLTHDSMEESTLRAIGDYLSELFKCWIKDDDPSIRIKLFNTNIFSLTKNNQEYNTGFYENSYVITISSNGNVAPNDVLRNTQYWDPKNEPNIFRESLVEILNSDLFLYIQNQKEHVPSYCEECCWKNICKGGSLINRYSKKNYFNNPSVYCNSLKSFYAEITTYLLSNGISFQKIHNNLKLCS